MTEKTVSLACPSCGNNQNFSAKFALTVTINPSGDFTPHFNRLDELAASESIVCDECGYKATPIDFKPDPKEERYADIEVMLAENSSQYASITVCGPVDDPEKLESIIVDWIADGGNCIPWENGENDFGLRIVEANCMRLAGGTQLLQNVSLDPEYDKLYASADLVRDIAASNAPLVHRFYTDKAREIFPELNPNKPNPLPDPEPHSEDG